LYFPGNKIRHKRTLKRSDGGHLGGCEWDSVVGAVLGLYIVIKESKSEAVVFEFGVCFSVVVWVEELVAVVESGGFDGFADGVEN